MARTKNPLFRQVSGSLGGQIVYKQYYDKTVITTVPDFSKRKLSEKQLEWNKRMRRATFYAKYVCESEERKVRARIRLKLPPHKAVFQGVVKAHLDYHKNMPVDKFGDLTNTELDFDNIITL
jgi:hypothetical protein